jgi:hypothetical protein
MMTELIQKLWAQTVREYGHAGQEACAQQFAEVIVKECMGVARGMRNPTNLNYKPSERFVDELRLHFGVK